MTLQMWHRIMCLNNVYEHNRMFLERKKIILIAIAILLLATLVFVANTYLKLIMRQRAVEIVGPYQSLAAEYLGTTRSSLFSAGTKSCFALDHDVILKFQQTGKRLANGEFDDALCSQLRLSAVDGNVNCRRALVVAVLDNASSPFNHDVVVSVALSGAHSELSGFADFASDFEVASSSAPMAYMGQLFGRAPEKPKEISSFDCGAYQLFTFKQDSRKVIE